MWLAHGYFGYTLPLQTSTQVREPSRGSRGNFKMWRRKMDDDCMVSIRYCGKTAYGGCNMQVFVVKWVIRCGIWSSMRFWSSSRPIWTCFWIFEAGSRNRTILVNVVAMEVYGWSAKRYMAYRSLRRQLFLKNCSLEDLKAGEYCGTGKGKVWKSQSGLRDFMERNVDLFATLEQMEHAMAPRFAGCLHKAWSLKSLCAQISSFVGIYTQYQYKIIERSFKIQSPRCHVISNKLQGKNRFGTQRQEIVRIWCLTGSRVHVYRIAHRSVSSDAMSQIWAGWRSAFASSAARVAFARVPVCPFEQDRGSPGADCSTTCDVWVWERSIGANEWSSFCPMADHSGSGAATCCRGSGR